MEVFLHPNTLQLTAGNIKKIISAPVPAPGLKLFRLHRLRLRLRNTDFYFFTFKNHFTMYFLNNIPALVNDLFRDFNEEHRTEPDLRIQ